MNVMNWSLQDKVAMVIVPLGGIAAGKNPLNSVIIRFQNTKHFI